jgi:SAM-dependent methyltransferase
MLVAVPNPYRYPDPGDRLTAATIRAGSIGASELRRQELEVLDHFAGRLTSQLPRRQLLDYGSGEGRLSSHFATSFEHITAYEPDDQRRATHAERIRGDGRRVELLGSFDRRTATATFNAVLCSHVIQHIARDAANAVMADLAAALRPDGALLLLTTFAGPPVEQAPRYVIARLNADGETVESDVEAADFNAAYRRNTPGELPIHFYGMGELLAALTCHRLHPVEIYGLHGSTGVMGPLAPSDPAFSHQPSNARSHDILPHCRDVAIIAVLK